MQTELDLNPLNYFNLDGELIFYVSNRNLSEKNTNLLASFKDELCNSEFITICRVTDTEDKGLRYTFLTNNFLFDAYLSDRPNFSLGINSIISDKDFLSRKKNYYYQKSVFIIKTQKRIAVICNGNKYTCGGFGNTQWAMDSGVTSTLINSINLFFDGKRNTVETGKISNRFEKNIIQPIRNFTNYEYEAEKNAAFSNDQFNYDSFRIVSSSAKKKIYEFYSTSFDPESELFSSGSRVCVETNISVNDEVKQQILGTVVDKQLVEDGVSLKIEFLNQFDNSILVETDGHIYPQVNETQKKVRTDVIRKIYNHQIASKYMYDFFSNYSTQGFEPQEGWNEFYNELMSKKYPPNESQMEAIKKGIETKDIQLVLGPPGTGKTTVIVAWIEYFIRHNKRVLISSQNNSAVDNVLERVGKNPCARIIRIGNMDKIQENCKQYSVESQIDTISDNYEKKIEENLNRIPSDRKKVEDAISYIDNSKELFENLTNKYQSLDGFRPEVNTIKRKLGKAFLKSQKYLNTMRSFQRKNTLEKMYLKSVFSRNIFFIISYFPSIITSNLKIKINQLVIILLSYFRNKVVADYNDSSSILQKLLLEPEYQKLKTEIKSIDERINSGGFDLKIDTPLQIPSLSSLFKSGHYNGSYEDVLGYRQILNGAIKSLEKIESSLIDWKSTIKSKNSDVISDLIIQNSNVVGATCVGINTQKRFSSLDFDVSIIDESGQIQIHNAIIPMTRAPKTLMLGDHLQIPPMANDAVVSLCKDDGINTRLLEMSFFEYLFTTLEDNKKGKKGNRRSCPNITRLNEQFRMPGNISDVISEWFYEGNYHARYDMEKWTPIIEKTNSPLILVSTSKEKNREELGPNDSKDKSPGYSNPLEAKLIANIVTLLFKRDPDFNCEKIGVISAYGKQVRLIRTEIKRALKKANIKVSDAQIYSIAASLDSFQGQERPLIIYSSTRSSSKKSPMKPRVGFMKELRRLNVAFTRCQKQLVIIGDFDYLTSCQYEELDPEKQEPLPNKSEKKYSEFMKKMVAQSQGKNGEYYLFEDFKNRVGI